MACAPRGPEAGLVFSLSGFSRWWRGRCFFFRSNGFALRAGQRQGGVFRIPPPYLWTPLSPQRVKGCSPLTSPKKKSKPKNASRFAKRIFLCFSHLRLRRRFHVSAGRYRQQRGNTSCEAANRRNEKKALSAATSFFPFRQLLRGLKGASSPFLVDPARRNRWWFSGSLLTRKRELSPNAKVLYPRAPAREPFLVLFWCAKENFSFSSPPARYSAVPHPTATRRECVPPAPSFSGGCGPASRGLPMSGQ